MARRSLLFAVAMGNGQPQDRRCSYVLAVANAAASTEQLRELASYLSTLSVAGCEVIILDAAPRMVFEENARILRWVGRHIAAGPEHRSPSGAIDVVRMATTLGSCEKVIVAAEDVRYTPEAIGQLCDLLELHEVVEPQDYLDPLPWWGGIEAGRILLHRGIEPQPDHGATFAFRRTSIRSLRSPEFVEFVEDHARRLVAAGAEVYAASNVFVRREPGALDEWFAERARAAGDDFALPVKTAFFLSLLPLLLLLAVLGGAQLAGAYTSVIAFASIALALRGRSGAATFFPLRACLFAPVWVFERSVSVYWALCRKLSGADVAEPDVTTAPQADTASSMTASRPR